MNSLAVSYRFCRKLARRTGKNFYYSFLTLPRDKHMAMCAVYAWNRLLDDCVDDAPGPAEARQALQDWEIRTREALGGGAPAGKGPDAGLWEAFRDTVSRYRIPGEYFFETIRGAEMDLSIRGYEDFQALYQYCYRVASVVGLACLHIFEFTHEQARKHGEWLGIAFQLTNILRDVKEDAARGRVYLPEADLLSFGIKSRDVLDLKWSEELRDLIESYACRARMYYVKAEPLFGMVRPEARPTLEIMSEIYGGILKRLREIDYDVFNHRAGLSTLDKLRVVARHKIARPAPAETGQPEPPDLTPLKIGLIGGGLAGLSAAAALGEFGHDITLFEQSFKLGGKASQFLDEEAGTEVENPVHLWLGAHQSVGEFFSMIGARRHFETGEDWRILSRRKMEVFRAGGSMPFPLNLLARGGAFGLSLKQRWKVFKAVCRLISYSHEERIKLDRVTFLDWLRFHGQNDSIIEGFWKPFLNFGIADPVHCLSTRQAAFFLRQLGGRHPLRWHAPAESIADVYNESCREFLKSRRVKLRMRETVSGVFFDRQWHVVTEDGVDHVFDHVILALPPGSVKKVLNPKDYAVLSARSRFEKLRFLPGLLARFEFRQPLFEHPYTVLDDAPFTWGVAAQVPRMSSMRRAPFSVSFLGHDFRPYTYTRNPNLMADRLRDIWETVMGAGAMPVESEYWFDVNRDFASEPGSFDHRPSQETPLPGLWLAGDWTQTGWPAGLEGSANSGFRCAEKFLRKRGWNVRFGPLPRRAPGFGRC